MGVLYLLLRHGLLSRDGGDRVMAAVLAAVPVHGLETVLVAVELVLAAGPVSIEHVLNIIARLTHPARPLSVETELIVHDEPRAAPERYDALRAQISVTEEADHA